MVKKAGSVLVTLLCCSGWMRPVLIGASADNSWKAGTAKLTITPDESLWMAGYASRKKPSEGKVQDLFAKALALEDGSGHRAVVVTTDLIGLSRSVAEAIATGVKQRTGLRREQLLLTSSHTHTGPVIRESLLDMYNLSPEQGAAINRYTRKLEEQIVGLVESALKNRVQAHLYFGKGQAGFAVNRRAFTPEGVQIGVNPAGPVDHTVPVLKITDLNDRVLAIVMSYACHNTTLTGEFYQFSGDYAGFAQQYLEQQFPQSTVLFMMGCGGDANPNPRGQLEMAEQHGRSLADAVSRAPLHPIKPVTGRLKARFERVNIPIGPLPSRQELQSRLQQGDVFRQRHARRMLSVLDQKGKLPDKYPYPIQVWQVADLTLVALAGEVVVDYDLRLNKELAGADLWIVAYANDVFAYIPSARVLKEGGYEANQSGIYYGMPGPFAPEVETIIVQKIKQMVRKSRGKS